MYIGKLMKNIVDQKPQGKIGKGSQRSHGKDNIDQGMKRINVKGAKLNVLL